MDVASQFRQALKPGSHQATVRFLDAKVEFDERLSHLTAILHNSLFRSLKELRSGMRDLPGSVNEAVTHGWSSVFPCMAVGFNRTTKLHRDSKGIRNGLDIITVLGKFSGGHFHLPELGLRFEWLPGCMAAFDGYDLAHEVRDWDGTHRVTLISFCRGSSWRGLGLSSCITPPTLVDLRQNLQQAVADKEAAGKEVLAGRKRKPSVDSSAGSLRHGDHSKESLQKSTHVV